MSELWELNEEEVSCEYFGASTIAYLDFLWTYQLDVDFYFSCSSISNGNLLPCHGNSIINVQHMVKGNLVVGHIITFVLCKIILCDFVIGM